MSDLRESLTQSGTLYGFINTIVYAHDYTDLSNKPQINGVTLQGNKTASELGLVTPATEAVQSVNGETGAVVLDGNDIAYDGNNTINQQIDAVAASIPVIPVTSVNGETGDVVLDGSDIRYDSDYTVNAKIDAVAADIPVVPVQSVNGETGNVVLDGNDIAYDVNNTINQQIDAVAASIPVIPVTSVNGETGAVVLDDTDIEHSTGVSVNSIINTITQYTPVYGNTASGAIATFDTSLALPLQDCTIEINGTNLTDANIKVAGANLWNEDWELGNISTSDGQPSTSTLYIRSKVYCACKGGATYYCKSHSTSQLVIYWYDANDTYLGFDVCTNTTKTAPANAVKFKIRCEVTTYSNDISINYPSTDTAYHPYNANTTTTISWSDLGTVSEGTLDVTTGKLTVVNGSMGAGVYQITPIPINQLSGTNNIFCDTGNTSVVYACSLKDYIDSQ